jgi:hypothetical protein
VGRLPQSRLADPALIDPLRFTGRLFDNSLSAIIILNIADRFSIHDQVYKVYEMDCFKHTWLRRVEE